MTLDDIRAYVSRDWATVQEQKRRSWAERLARMGPAEGIRLADDMRRYVVSIRPDWPTPGDRAPDLASHIELCALLRRADAAISR
jgi:hypothetical protein